MKSFLVCRYGGTVLTEEGEGRDWVLCLSGFKSFMLREKFFIFFSLCFFFLNMLTWKIVAASKASVLYIYIDKASLLTLYRRFEQLSMLLGFVEPSYV